ncbi:RND family efflux transporter, membrane subunit [Campylobacter pinnipediorum subsp. pinnipediorum]|uniref:efflux RND transporter permease subunit n=1 Tax=Campylobacter pinnipediorum TaxID=1965231 RepID=UPI0009949D13|nr:efflux RND transporter permease subunit [Campylobacter pinnipediorum]AQW81418.1 RND family efflux transporter, membrane subunit [Campylobacter pinnipediorum subsp. pinnipediorum]
MYKFAINRPITTLMIFLSLFVFGIISIRTMSISLFPDVEIPLVKITTFAKGDKNYINNKITKKLEDEVSSIDGIKNINSVSYDNLSVVLIEFELEKNIEIALNDIRDKISKAGLPVKSITEKVSGSDKPIFSIFVSSKDKNTTNLMKVVDEKAITFLQRINGVGGINKVGFLKPQVNILLNPFLLNKFNLNAKDVAQIINLQNFQMPLGNLQTDDKKIVLSSDFNAKSIDELKNLRIKDGLFLQDIADVSFSHAKTDSLAIMDGKDGVMLEIKKINGINTIKTIKAIKESLKDFKYLIGDELDFNIAFDESGIVLKHIKQVALDMVLGIFLTALIVFLFLRSVSSTIIATIAIPVSIIGTFFIMDILGYDINRLTLVALTLGIGIFVDDAIVVIENISKKIENGEKNPLIAGFDGVRDIAFSVLGISLVLLCVFIPIAFMDGIVGRYFNSFAISVAGGIVVSFLVCIMLIPALCTRFLNTKKSYFYNKSSFLFEALDNSYGKVLDLILRFKFIFIIITFCIFAFCISFAGKVGIDFMPSEDNSEFNIFIKADPSSSIDFMQDKLQPIINTIKDDKRIEYFYTLVGYDDAKQAYKAKIYAHLGPVSKRNQRQKDIMADYRNKLDFSDLNISITDLPIVDTGDNEPVQIIITGDSFDELENIFLKVKKMLTDFGGVIDIKSKNEDKSEQIKISMDREKLSKLHISEYEVATIINTSFSQNTISLYDNGVNQYDIVIGFDDKFKKDIQELKKIRVKNAFGEFFTLDNIASFEIKKDILFIPRYNKQNELKILANLDNIPLGNVSAYLDENIPEILPQGYSKKYTGFIKLMKNTNEAFIFTISLSALLIYMILAALYESFVLPFVIMISMPLAFAGVVVGLLMSGNSFSLFVMVGSILLFGMVGKNAILVVDFANKYANSGIDLNEAIKKAGIMRLHAILMTTFAMIFAMLPLAISKGAGYEANSPMSIAIISGLISSTILTLLIVPALFSFAYKLDKYFKRFYEREKI